MRLPTLTENAAGKDMTEEFKGIDHNIRTGAGEWYDMKNMTTDYYPVASSRGKRALQVDHSQIHVLGERAPTGDNYHFKTERLLGAAYADGEHIIGVKEVYKSDDSILRGNKVGAWFVDENGLTGVNGVDHRYNVQYFSLSQIIETEDGYKLQFTIVTPDDVPSGESWHTCRLKILDENDTVYADVICKGGGNSFSYTLPSLDEVQRLEATLSTVVRDASGVYVTYRDVTAANQMLAEVPTALFSTSNKNRCVVRMGARLVVMPDGVVLEADGSVLPIKKEASISGLKLVTVIEDDESADGTGYTELSLLEDTAPEDMQEGIDYYRYADKQIQYYIPDKELWVNQPTFVRIYKTGTGTFDGFNEGDVIALTISDVDAASLVANGVMYGIVAWDAVASKIATNPLHIRRKGTMTVDGADVDYIIVDGYVAQKATTAGTPIYAHLYTNNETLTMTRQNPTTAALACECQNRIWTCDKNGHEIYASALGNPYNFYDYSGQSTDSFSQNVGSYGEFTGCINFKGQPHFFKEHTLHIITGLYSSNEGVKDGYSYNQTEVQDFRGVEKGSERSLAIIDNVLYYKSAAGIVGYDGANTVVISDALGKKKYKNAVAGAYGTKYYVCMENESGQHILFVYDTKLGTWCKEDDINIKQFVNVGTSLVFITDDDSVYSVVDENLFHMPEYAPEGDVEWFCETGNIGYSYPNNKYISRLQLRLTMTLNSRATVYVQYDSDGNWIRKGEMHGKGTRTFLLPIVPQRCDHMNIKIEGKGDVKIISLAKILEEGGDIV